MKCTNLKNVTLSKSMTQINALFADCSNLTTISIPSGVTSINGFAFQGCTNLASIIIPDSLASIDEAAFYKCDSLKDVYYSGSKTQWDEIDIKNYNNNNIAIINATKHYNSTGPDDTADPPTPPGPSSPGDGSIVSLFPISGAEDVGYDASNPPVFKIEFDREIASAYDQEFVADVDLTMDGAFSIYRASDDKLIYKPSEYAKFAFNLDTAKTVLTVTPVNNHTLLEPNTRYYITMGEGFVRFADGTGSPAIEKGEWGFKTLEEFTLPEAIIAKVPFKVDDGKSKEIDTTWNDGWFLNPATEYNRDLAITAVTLSGAAYVEDEDELPRVCSHKQRYAIIREWN